MRTSLEFKWLKGDKEVAMETLRIKVTVNFILWTFSDHYKVSVFLDNHVTLKWQELNPEASTSIYFAIKETIKLRLAALTTQTRDIPREVFQLWWRNKSHPSPVFFLYSHVCTNMTAEIPDCTSLKHTVESGPNSQTLQILQFELLLLIV